ncbi:MAG: cobalamin B12-binding domain-containing protein [Candidatus Izemoplasma sp.]|nr:cobalamin B12-binding domain-containing protein [Candidatus Izemoplasma sp.]
MKKEYKALYETIKQAKKSKAVHMALDMVKNGKIDIITLYEHVLEPVLNDIDCGIDDLACIWQEHIRTNIVRTIIEAMYVHLEEMFKNNDYQSLNKKVLVVCPTEEYHEIRARMATDFFYLVGYESIYIGANTPLHVIISAIKEEKLDILALSVTNRYHLSVTKHLVDAVKVINPDIKIYVGGRAFSSKDADTLIEPDKILWTFADFEALVKGIE